MRTYPEWEATVLEHVYENVDYLALHQYYGGQEMGTADFLAQSVDLDCYIDTVSGCRRSMTRPVAAVARE